MGEDFTLIFGDDDGEVILGAGGVGRGLERNFSGFGGGVGRVLVAETVLGNE
jgi:hypothetical protein